jgi:hypothetical protein
VVVTAGVTEVEPEEATGPIPLLMEMFVAFVVDQVRVADCPPVMVDGVALRMAVGGVPMTATVAERVVVPPVPVAVSV